MNEENRGIDTRETGGRNVATRFANCAGRTLLHMHATHTTNVFNKMYSVHVHEPHVNRLQFYN